MPGKGAAQSQFVGQTKKASETGCLSCHGRDYLGILTDWKTSIEDSLKELKPELERARKLIKGVLPNHQNYQEANDLYLRAKFNYDFVTYGNGAAHNVEYSTALLAQAQEDVEKAITLLSR